MSTLRFGQSAKKIENKFHANVTSDENDEKLKKIISDYEKRLEEYESKSYETAKLLKKIEELQDQKSKLDH